GAVWRFRPARLAFPGAEGYGRFAIGGRGGRVIEVTNLNDAGLGSLRAAVEADGPRTVVFRVGATIPLKDKLVVKNPYLTVAAQPLNMSVHSHDVGTGKRQSCAGSISGDIGSYHHNRVVGAAGRNWSLAGGYTQGHMFGGKLDIRNNVIYNWEHRTTDGGVRLL